MDERGAPILDDSRLFRKLVEIKDKKDRCIHPVEQRIKEGKIPLGIVPDGLISPWEFDRIVYYLVQENRIDLDMEHLCECMTTELEKVRAREQEQEVSLIPLHYAIRALERGIGNVRRGPGLSAKVRSEVHRVAHRVDTFLLVNSSRDAGGHIKENLVALRAAFE